MKHPIELRIWDGVKVSQYAKDEWLDRVVDQVCQRIIADEGKWQCTFITSGDTMTVAAGSVWRDGKMYIEVWETEIKRKGNVLVEK